MLRVLVAMSLFLSGHAWAINSSPYPTGKVSFSQWQAYLKEVSSEPTFEKNVVLEEKFVAFHDNKAGTQYVFTLEGNPAHPTALVRFMKVKSGKVAFEEVGYYAGDANEFNKLFEFFKKRNQQLAAQLNEQRAPDEKSSTNTSR